MKKQLKFTFISLCITNILAYNFYLFCYYYQIIFSKLIFLSIFSFNSTKWKSLSKFFLRGKSLSKLREKDEDLIVLS